MNLMIIRDVMCVEGKGLVLTGPLLLVDVARQSDVEWLLGRTVSVSGNNGQQLHVCIKGVSVRQAMSGATEASLGVESPPDGVDVLVDSVVTIDE